jgi:hypothetical protein
LYNIQIHIGWQRAMFEAKAHLSHLCCEVREHILIRKHILIREHILVREHMLVREHILIREHSSKKQKRTCPT